MLNFGKLWAVFFVLLMLFGCKSQNDDVYFEFEQKEVLCTWSESKWLTKGGLKVCPNNRVCSDEQMVPYQPCVQPMPTYYNDVNLSEGDVELIHPYTRIVVLCMERNGGDVKACVEKFRDEGYVLITDIPQLPAKYDIIEKGGYPARKWSGNRGQNVPRW